MPVSKNTIMPRPYRRKSLSNHRLASNVHVMLRLEHWKGIHIYISRKTPGINRFSQALRFQAIKDTLALAGSWRALDWDDMMQELDRIRHESKPTPPIDLNV